METNDSRLVRVPKKEFVRVLAGIMDSATDPDAAKEDETSMLNSDTKRAHVRVGPTPRHAAARLAAAEAERNSNMRNGSVRVKRDSFFYLQNALERRAREREGLVVEPVHSKKSPKVRFQHRQGSPRKSRVYYDSVMDAT